LHLNQRIEKIKRELKFVGEGKEKGGERKSEMEYGEGGFKIC
jgi:hypothetical protein